MTFDLGTVLGISALVQAIVGVLKKYITMQGKQTVALVGSLCLVFALAHAILVLHATTALDIENAVVRAVEAWLAASVVASAVRLTESAPRA